MQSTVNHKKSCGHRGFEMYCKECRKTTKGWASIAERLEKAQVEISKLQKKIKK